SLATSRTLYSSLFPYTTLFRSGVLLEVHFLQLLVIVHVQQNGHDGAGLEAELEFSGEGCAEVFPGRLGRAAQGGDQQLAGQQDQDRKSTRLNSSHQIISYAVFC